MTRFRADNALWIQSGKKAAEAGRSGEALYAICVLMSTLFSAMETIVDNQFELERVITNATAAKGAATNGHKP